MSSSALGGGNPLRQLWSAYERQLERRPVLTQMSTSALLWGTGDAIAQRFERWEAQQRQQRQQQQRRRQQQPGAAAAAVPGAPPGAGGLDARRAALTGAFGAAFVGPVGHFWYAAIDRWCARLVPGGGAAFIAAKVLLDTVVMGPFYVSAFMAWGCAVIDRTGLSDFRRKMATDFVPTLAAEVSLWPVVQAFNFSLVPVKHQLLLINVFTIIDAAFMSWARNQEDWFGRLLERLREREREAGGGGGKGAGGHAR